ncbi:MAG: hypothetical protein ACI364_01455 [Coriobacteriales bacterium]
MRSSYHIEGDVIRATQADEFVRIDNTGAESYPSIRTMARRARTDMLADLRSGTARGVFDAQSTLGQKVATVFTISFGTALLSFFAMLPFIA